MTGPAKEFRLVLDPLPLNGEAPVRPAGGDLPILSVAPGVSYLTVVPGELPRLEHAPTSRGMAFALEAVGSRGQDQLLLISPAGHAGRCNGQPLPRLALLAVKDQLQLGDHLLHVTLFHRPRLGPSPTDFVGRECPVCRLAITPETRIFICPHCETPLHCEGEDRPKDERLECVYLGSECPMCHRALVLQEGYAYFPEVTGA
jgi:hypothetical protein